MKTAMPLLTMRSASESLSWIVPIMDLLLTWPKVLVVRGVHRPGGAARGYAAPPRSGPGAGPPDQSGGGIRGGRRMTVSRRGDGTATGQQASAQTVRPG